MSAFHERLKAHIAARQDAGLKRQLLPIEAHQGKFVQLHGQALLSFASNDFLGLAATDLTKIVSRRGSGSGASRLVTGTTASTLDAEKALAKFFGYESCLILGSGFLANLTLIATLFGPEHTLLLDKRAHTSTVTGILHSQAAFHTFRHNSLSHLEKLLQTYPADAILTESLFSMDGDSPDFTHLAKLKQKFKCTCIVDEAHAYGMLGEHGRGLAHGLADIAIGTFGKAFGLFGAFILMPEIVREYLIHFGQGFIYTTALPPWHGQAVLHMLDLITNADTERAHVHDLGTYARKILNESGFVVHGNAHILGIEIGGADLCQHTAERLMQKGILLFAARYPTVPLNKAMLRVCLTALHNENDIDSLRDALCMVRKEEK